MQIKSRRELHWLYYPEGDSVRVINAHDFGGGGGVVTEGLVGHWSPSLDTAGNGTTTLTDLSGSNDGTLTNMDAATDWVADTANGGVRALDFDGTNDQVIISSPYDFSTAGSVSAWIYVSDTTTRQQVVCCRFTSTKRFGIGITSGVIGWNWYTGTYYSKSETITTGWHHVVGIHSGSNAVAAYLNGVAMTGAANVNAIQGAFDRLVLSGRTHTTADSFAGRLDAIRIYDRALTTDEIATLYDSGNGRGLA